jgi:hypothetical protein
MDDAEIDRLIKLNKTISTKPRKEMKQEGSYYRDEFELKSLSGDARFKVFMRRHADWQENFSIGLVYLPGDDGSVCLFRCNGNHGEAVVDPLIDNGTHFDYHTHKMTADRFEMGIKEPGPFENADYASFEQALRYFCRYVGITDATQYFPNLYQQDLFQ